MKEAIGNAFIFGLVITFIGIFILFFATSTSYTKAFKVKNKIIEIIEKHSDILSSEPVKEGRLSNDVEAEINTVLSDIGYKIAVNKNNCPVRNGKDAIVPQSNYDYCIYEYSTVKGKYYGVATYMYYQIPVIGIELKFPVYGETKISGILG